MPLRQGHFIYTTTSRSSSLWGQGPKPHSSLRSIMSHASRLLQTFLRSGTMSVLKTSSLSPNLSLLPLFPVHHISCRNTERQPNPTIPLIQQHRAPNKQPANHQNRVSEPNTKKKKRKRLTEKKTTHHSTSANTNGGTLQIPPPIGSVNDSTAVNNHATATASSNTNLNLTTRLSPLS